ncbi:hypothetical protein JTE90_021584 [Oedothorax gibbosus]|uniref:Uncharacterized protein n=1 Tax=Oedothorax gibbosus TaxID=931172 RepID=A0AAV6VQC3_9ARAC|nr:hypothetical protein JTE90_021584 [Oedothorax gibbosus]
MRLGPKIRSTLALGAVPNCLGMGYDLLEKGPMTLLTQGSLGQAKTGLLSLAINLLGVLSTVYQGASGDPAQSIR